MLRLGPQEAISIRLPVRRSAERSDAALSVEVVERQITNEPDSFHSRQKSRRLRSAGAQTTTK